MVITHPRHSKRRQTAKQRLPYFHLEGPHRDEAALLGDLVGDGVELSLALLGDHAAPEREEETKKGKEEKKIDW